jgi:membrane-bound ClpP family serine protease
VAYQPASAPAPQYAPAPVKQGNGFGVTALVLGIIGLVFAVIPVVNVFTAIPLGVLAIIFGIVALVKAGSRGGKGKGTGGTGLVLGILALGVAIAMNALVFNAAKEYVNEEHEQYMQDCQDMGMSESECQQIYDDTYEDLENL